MPQVAKSWFLWGKLPLNTESELLRADNFPGCRMLLNGFFGKWHFGKSSCRPSNCGTFEAKNWQSARFHWGNHGEIMLGTYWVIFSPFSHGFIEQQILGKDCGLSSPGPFGASHQVMLPLGHFFLVVVGDSYKSIFQMAKSWFHQGMAFDLAMAESFRP